MKTNLKWIATLASIVLTTACANNPMSNNIKTIRGTQAEERPPQAVKTVSEIPAAQSSYHYVVLIYPGLDENFDPDPKLVLTEYNQISQLDWYCAKNVDRVKGQAEEMLKQGGTYGGFQGILGALGYQLGFGSLIKPMDYLIAIGLTGVGGGLGSGKITFDMALNTLHGYCMTGMVYKADALEGKLSRVFISPLYTGSAKIPEVTDKVVPTYPARNKAGYVPPPPR